MSDKVVLITGAGFSAPADLPIQNKILREMTEELDQDFIEAEVGRESLKFLASYIQISLFLLDEYTDVDVEEYAKKYEEITGTYRSNSNVRETIDYIWENNRLEAEQRGFDLYSGLEDAITNFTLDKNEYYLQLVSLKEHLRKLLKSKDIQIELEDIFTLFDKSISKQENTADYTYSEIDRLQHAILRLFIYYFSKRVNAHDFTHEDYLATIKFLKNKDVSIITTNWDILFEQYLNNAKVPFDYGFISEYVFDQNKNSYSKTAHKENDIQYIKVHGSINWFRCLRCGNLQVQSAEQCGQYLFDDAIEEHCPFCGQESKREDDILLKPEFITPTMMKAIDSQLYNNLWHNAAHELQQADKIIICGYSLPVADYEFRYLLKQNIHKSTPIDVVLYHDDKPEKSTEDKRTNLCPEYRFRNLFPSNKCEFYYEGFGEYFKKLNGTNGAV